jgi:drug/metabolite transporter (DMT)-like permease
MSTQRASDPFVYLKLVAVSVIWGGTFVAGRFLAGTPPMLSACLRFVLASLTLALFLACARKPLARVGAGQLLQLAVLGFFGIFTYNVCFFHGLAQVSASRASLIVALNPAMIALAAFVCFRESLSVRRVGGIGLCLVGAATVILSRSPDALGQAEAHWRGDLAIFGCVLSWVVFSVFSRNLARAIGPLHTVTYSIWLGTLMLLAGAGVSGQLGTPALAALAGLPALPLLSLVYLGAVGSALAYIWYYDAIQKIGATRSGVFIALNPLTAVLLGALLLDERLSLPMFAGGTLVILGIFLCNRAPPAARAPASSALRA